MQYLGEIISLVVAVLWTATALFANEASRRIGAMSANFFRMAFSGILLAGLLWVTIGHPYPAFADGKTWLWMALSALVGYVFGDFCLFNSYVVIGARFGQLFMTLAPVFAAFAGWALLGETLSWRSWLAMAVTLSGIAISILSRSGEGHKLALKLPLKGVLLGVGAGMGQGVGLVLSKIGLQHYAEALPTDAPAAFEFTEDGYWSAYDYMDHEGYSVRQFGPYSTGLWGLLMNVLSTCAFVCAAAYFYQRTKTIKSAIVGLVVGVLMMTVLMLLWNWLITPIYMIIVGIFHDYRNRRRAAEQALAETDEQHG